MAGSLRFVRRKRDERSVLALGGSSSLNKTQEANELPLFLLSDSRSLSRK